MNNNKKFDSLYTLPALVIGLISLIFFAILTTKPGHEDSQDWAVEWKPMPSFNFP